MPDMGIGEAMLISAVIGGGAEVTKDVIQSNQAGKATDAMLAGNTQALDFEKQRYAQAQQNYAPYLSMGQNALKGLQGSATNVPYAKYGMSLNGLSNFGGQGMPSGQPMNPGQPPTTPGMGDTVRMQAPDGSQQAVPRNAVAHYMQRGARVIG